MVSSLSSEGPREEALGNTEDTESALGDCGEVFGQMNSWVRICKGLFEEDEQWTTCWRLLNLEAGPLEMKYC
jgi:hypothetical protein